MLMVMLLMLGASPMEVFVKADAAAAGDKPITVFGTLRRTSDGTAIVLDDGAAILVTTDDPPREWSALLGKYLRATGVLSGNRLTGWSAPAAAIRNLARLNGKQVELHGTAQNAKGGAILLVDNAPIYLQHVGAWPDAKRGKPAVVKGTLKSMKLIPSPQRSPDGAISQGAEGDQWVLEDPTY
jgi:hypothetical protein